MNNKKYIKDIKDISFLSKRDIKKEEKNLFMLSKWSNTSIIMLIFFIPFFALFFMSGDDPKISLIILPVLIILLIPAFISYKKRQDYINKRVVYTIKGDIHFDESLFSFYIGNEKLKLHGKWHRYLRGFMKKNTIIKNVTLEAILHTYDFIDEAEDRAFQPISLRNEALTINNSMLDSTRSYVLPLLIVISSSIIVFSTSYDNFLPNLYYSLRDVTQNNIPTLLVDDNLYENNIKEKQMLTLKGMVIPLSLRIPKVRMRYEHGKSTTSIVFDKVDQYVLLVNNTNADIYKDLVSQDVIKQQLSHIEEIKTFNYQQSQIFYLQKGISLYLQKIFNYQDENYSLSYGSSEQLIKKQQTKLPSQRVDLMRFANYVNMMVEGNKPSFDYLRFKQYFLAFESAFSKDLVAHVLTIANHKLPENKGIKVIEFGYDLPTIARVGYYSPTIDPQREPLKIMEFLNSYPKPATLTGIIHLRNDPSNARIRHELVNKTYTSDNRIYLISVTLLWTFFIVVMLFSFIVLIRRIKGHYFDKGTVVLFVNQKHI